MEDERELDGFAPERRRRRDARRRDHEELYVTESQVLGPREWEMIENEQVAAQAMTSLERLEQHRLNLRPRQSATAQQMFALQTAFVATAMRIIDRPRPAPWQW